jgi:hypothetical protein
LTISNGLSETELRIMEEIKGFNFKYDGLINILAQAPEKFILVGHFLDFIGGPCWDRTNDLLIKSQLLYQLS